MQGLSRLSMVFTQFGVASLALAVVHIAEAAARHPPISKVAAALFFAIAGDRTLLLLAASAVCIITGLSIANIMHKAHNTSSIAVTALPCYWLPQQCAS